MRFTMADQSGLLRESFAANVAHIRPFSCMNQQMLPVSGSTGESLAADVTVVRPVAGMSHHVLLQSVILRERLAALLAHEALSALVLQQDVLIQILLSDHAPLADLAFVLRLEVRPLLMHVERIAVRARFPADVADYRALLVLEAYVQPHVALHLELLAAILAIVIVVGAVLAIEMLLQPASALTFKFARVARILLRLGGGGDGASALASPLDHALRGMFSADVRVNGRLVVAQVSAELALVRYGLFRLLVRRLLMALQHLHLGKANVALVAGVDPVVLAVAGLVSAILIRDRNLVHRSVLFLRLHGVILVQRLFRINHVVVTLGGLELRILNANLHPVALFFRILFLLLLHL